MIDSAPVHTDGDLVVLVADSIGAATGRRTWLFLFDADARPLPVVIPIDGMPLVPDGDDAAVFADRIRMLVEKTPAESVAVVWERPGDAALTKKDAGWIGRLHGTGAPIRAQLISGDDGVRLVDPSAVDPAA